MKEENRRDLLKFFTGSTRIPLDGFDPPLNITEGVDMPMVSETNQVMIVRSSGREGKGMKINNLYRIASSKRVLPSTISQ